LTKKNNTSAASTIKTTARSSGMASPSYGQRPASLWQRLSSDPDRAVLWAIAIASAARLIYAIALWDRVGGPDGVTYDTMAQGFAHHGLLSSEVPNQPAWPPLYSLLLATIYRIVGHHPVVVKPFQVALIAWTTWIAYLVAKKIFAQPTALLTGLGMSMSLVWLSLGHPLMYEPLLAGLLITGIWLLLEHHLVWAGLSFGLGALAQSKMAPFIVVGAVLAVALWRSWRAFVAVVLAGLAPIALWVGRMQVVYHELIPIRSFNGYTILIGNNDAATGGYENIPLDVLPAGCVGLNPYPASHYVETDRRFTRCALDWAVAHPRRELALIGPRSFKLFAPFEGPWELDSTWRHHFDPRRLAPTSLRATRVFGIADATVTGGYLVVWIALGVAGLVLALRRGAAGMLVTAPVLFVYLTVLGSIGDGRFRIPILPEWAILQAAGAVWLCRRLNIARLLARPAPAVPDPSSRVAA
jgi:hypothetical protein